MFLLFLATVRADDSTNTTDISSANLTEIYAQVKYLRRELEALIDEIKQIVKTEVADEEDDDEEYVQIPVRYLRQAKARPMKLIEQTSNYPYGYPPSYFRNAKKQRNFLAVRQNRMV